ncbi:MAG: hypothetical protein V7L31_05905 [Nostoc sp.]
MTLAMRREFQFPADKRFRVKLTPMSIAVPLLCGLFISAIAVELDLI